MANPNCPICRGAGFLHPRDPDSDRVLYDQVVPCRCLREAYREEAKKPATILRKGVANLKHTFETFKPKLGATEALAAFKALAYDETDKPFLLCYGAIGNGKSHLCEAFTQALNQRGIDCRIWTVANVISQLKESIPENTTERLIKWLQEAPALVLDDFGVEYGSEWELSKIEQIIDERYRYRRLTVLTSNRELPDLEKKSERILSRFSDPDVSVLVCNAAEDFRRK